MKFNDNIAWPLYKIRGHKELYEENNILYIVTDYNKYIIDNKNISGKTLGVRRLKLKAFLNSLEDKDTKLYRFTKIFYTFSELLADRKTPYQYIDSNGKLHHFRKKYVAKVIYTKVLENKVTKNGLLCFCEDFSAPIEVPYIPRYMPVYIGLLKLGKSYHLYDLSLGYKKNTWRKV